MKITLLAFFTISLTLVQAQILKTGEWRGEISYDSHYVPFLFEVLPSGTPVPEITFINGQERITVNNASIVRDSLFIPLDPFDVVLKARFTAMGMSGVYVKNYRNTSMPFSAVYDAPRFIKRSAKTAPKIPERWNITFSPDSPSMSKGVGLFTQRADQVTGTVLSETSDYRYFEGIMDGDSLKLSSFDGAHAFMILGKKVSDGWEGEIIFDNNYSEPWVATGDKEAELTDPFEAEVVERGVHKPYYDLLAAGSGRNAVDVSKYENKVLIIQVFGTWCPNSLDQTKYLVKWFKKNKEKDVAILASSYEANYSQEYGLKRLQEYKEKNKIEYDLVLGGRLSKTAAATPFPFMEKIMAFPTLVIVDKEGYVRYVHSYFNGPATGTYYQAFDDRFNEIVEKLLAE